LPICAVVLSLIVLPVAAATIAAVWFGFPAIAPGLAAPQDTSRTLLDQWPRVLKAGLWILVITCIVAALGQGWSEWGALRRRRQLTDLSALPPLPPPGAPSPSRTGGRRIVICCDGTSNRPDQQEDGQSAATNVYKLSQGLIADEQQTVWYQAGVGSDTSSTAQEAQRAKRILNAVGAEAGAQAAAMGSRILKAFEGAFGSGISESIVNGYTEIVRQYRPGDRIYLIGFSRGAYAARCIAGVISRCGLLRAENLRYAPEVVRLYRMRSDIEDEVTLRPTMIHEDVPIEFLGVFDTVASLGVPLWGWWFRALPIWRNKALATDPAAACRHVYHALSMDERRSQFFPTLFTHPDPGKASRLETLEQVWFRGAHADIGGGYARTGLSDITMGWMMDAMSRHGLVFRPGTRAGLRPDTLAPLHDELSRRPSWRLFGSWPRWHPTSGPDALQLHRSVLRRAAISQHRLNRPDLQCLTIGQSLDITVEAKRDWDRTGIVIEDGALYRLTWLDGCWRDGERPLCGPTGQARPSLFGWSRRLPGQPWLRMTATVAHPRPWKLRERGLLQLIRLLFVNDPKELRRQLAPIGRDLQAPGATVFLRNMAASGLLHIFANDYWHAAGDNSGGIRLRITRVADVAPQATCWTLKAGGCWKPPLPPG
jgi:uncharacterized protein (DUF2235 family)